MPLKKQRNQLISKQTDGAAEHVLVSRYNMWEVGVGVASPSL